MNSAASVLEHRWRSGSGHWLDTYLILLVLDSTE
jgi:hypothetical protein